MKTTNTLRARACVTAIAAVMALPSTALAQEAAVSADPAPVTTTDPAPAAETTPVDSTVTSASESPAAAVKTAKTSRPSAAKRSAATVRSAPKPVAKRASAPAATAPSPATKAAPVAASPMAAPATMVPATPAPQQPVEATAPNDDMTTALEFGGGALALLALGGAALAMNRRKRRNDEEQEVYLGDEAVAPAAVEEPMVLDQQVAEAQPTTEPLPTHEPQPIIVAPPMSAFAWGSAPVSPQAQQPEANAGDDRRPGETWVDRAMRGPTPDNPSLSLRKRLKRAAFFDKREREVAAGEARPVETDAGLPDAMDSVGERQLEAA